MGAPIHNRDYIVAHYLESLNKLDYPREKLLFMFLANNCDDPTMGLLSSFKNRRNTTIATFDDVKSSPKRDGARYNNLVVLRNKLLEAVLSTPADLFLSVDSDLIIPPDSINRMVAHSKHVVSGLVYNDLHIGGKRNVPQKHICNILAWAGRKDRLGYPAAGHIRNYPENELIKVDITGAFVMMSRKVVEQVRYSYHTQGEDLGWAANLQSNGFQAWCDTGLRAIHLMTRAELEAYIVSQQVNA